MQDTFAHANKCPGCGSIDVNVATWGMPTHSFFEYMKAHEKLSRAITSAAFPEAPWRTAPHFFDEQEDYDDDDLYSVWYCPEQGRGLYAPGNAYTNGGCVIPEFVDGSFEPCTCRNCGNQWKIVEFDDDDDEDQDVFA